MEGTFCIDFFELSFLAEVCIPPQPIARAVFWQKLIDKHYHIMTDRQRSDLHQWVTASPRFDIKNEECALFSARFGTACQYKVIYDIIGVEHELPCFKFHDKYYTATDKWIDPKYIKKINKINI